MYDKKPKNSPAPAIKKLTIRKEFVRELDESELAQITGGSEPKPDTHPCRPCGTLGMTIEV